MLATAQATFPAIISLTIQATGRTAVSAIAGKSGSG